MTNRRQSTRGEPRCYSRVDDELLASSTFVTRIVKSVTEGDPDVVYRALGAFRDNCQGSPRETEALEELGRALRTELYVAAAEEVGCGRLQSLITQLEFTAGGVWPLLERHVRTCSDCLGLEENEGMRLLRSPALARQVLEQAATAWGQIVRSQAPG